MEDPRVDSAATAALTAFIVPVGRLLLAGAGGDLRRLRPRLPGRAAGRAPPGRLALLRVRWDPTLPERMVGDPRRLRQVITNLAVNALEFTVHGEVELRVEREGVPGGPDRFRVAVRDTGIGIAADDLANVFEPFTQVDSSHSRRCGGVGLGLAITRELVLAMGGTIEVSSTPGVGSTFSVHLPLAPAPAAERPAARAEL
jgi:signal transduction histidine kinase